jgi:hypothetical protein
MSLADAYLGAAGQAVALLREPAVTAAWDKPSALAGATVAELADHLAYQIFSVGPVRDDPPSDQAPIALLEHYERAAWRKAPVDSEANAGDRAGSEDTGSEGARSLAERAAAALADQRAWLPGVPGGQVVFMPQVGWALSLDDFLITRMTELAVHMDDLAVSTGLATPELADAAFDPVLVMLTRLAARDHGQAALLRALARAERAPEAINAI